MASEAPETSQTGPTGSSAVRALFSNFRDAQSARAKRRRLEVELRATVDPLAVEQAAKTTRRADEELGVRIPSDRYIGCTRLRTLRTLLSRVDQKGFERSHHQMQFHAAFERACSRIIYKEEFPVHFSSIMRHNNWDSVNGEVLISTPRRFGKTFSVAIFCATLALSCKQEIVIFSPGRRASRAILVRVQEFVGIAGFESNILEYNQEQLRVKTLDGCISTVRSFPSKKQITNTSEQSPSNATMAASHLDDQSDEVYRQNRSNDSPHVFHIEDVLRELERGHSRNEIKAGGLFCSHKTEMTFVIPTGRKAHFRHLLPKVQSARDVRTSETGARPTCPCSKDHLKAQVMLRDHNYQAKPVKFTVFRDCRKCSQVVYLADDHVFVNLETREVDECGHRFVTDVVYRSKSDGAIEQRIEVWRTHKTTPSNRQGREYLEVRCDHVLRMLNGTGDDTIRISCETPVHGMPLCVPCHNKKRAEQDRRNRIRDEQRRAKQRRIEFKRAQLEREEQERVEQERKEQERKEQERDKQRRAQQERDEQERKEQERDKQRREEQERIKDGLRIFLLSMETEEQERIEDELFRIKLEREEQERIEEERIELERAQQKRDEEERIEQKNRSIEESLEKDAKPILDWYDSRPELHCTRHPRWERGQLRGAAAVANFEEWKRDLESYAAFLDKKRNCPHEIERLERKRLYEEAAKEREAATSAVPERTASLRFEQGYNPTQEEILQRRQERMARQAAQRAQKGKGHKRL